MTVTYKPIPGPSQPSSASKGSSKLKVPNPLQTGFDKFAAAQDDETKLAALKAIKNAVIGNRTRKLEVLRTPYHIWSLVETIKIQSERSEDVRMEFEGLHGQVISQAVTILGSLSTGVDPSDVAQTLGHPNTSAHLALLTLLEHLLNDDDSGKSYPDVSNSIRQHFNLLHVTLVAIKNIFVQVSRVVGPRIWGGNVVGGAVPLGSGYEKGSSEVPDGGSSNLVSKGLDELFKPKNLDNLISILLHCSPSPSDPDPTTIGPPYSPNKPLILAEIIASLLHGCVRTRSQQNRVLGLSHKNEPWGNVDSSKFVKFPVAAANERVVKGKGKGKEVDDLLTSVEAVENRPEGGHSHVDPDLEEATAGGDRTYQVLIALLHLAEMETKKAGESALGAIAVLIRENSPAVRRLFVFVSAYSGKSAMDAVTDLIKDSPANVRAAAVACMTNFWKAAESMRLLFSQALNTRLKPLLQSLLNLMDEENSGINARAAFTFAYLVMNDEKIQEYAADLEVLKKLERLFKFSSREIQPYRTKDIELEDAALREGCLCAVAALCFASDDIRRDIVHSPLLAEIVTSLSSPHLGIRAAACQCTRAISRSVSLLRTSLVDAGAAKPLLELLRDGEDAFVKITATGAICNLVLEFSPMKEYLVEQGGIDRLAQLTHSTNQELRLNALWALKNAVYWSSFQLKQMVCETLGWDHLDALLRDPDRKVQEQSLTLLRNVACGDDAAIGLVLRGLGASQLLDLLEENLGCPDDEIVCQAAYVITNLATGNAQQKQGLVVRPGITKRILRCLGHSRADIRISASWTVLNFLDSDLHDRRISDIKTVLRNQGFEAKLQDMRDDPSQDVRERVKNALQLFESTGGSFTGER